MPISFVLFICVAISVQTHVGIFTKTDTFPLQIFLGKILSRNSSKYFEN